MEKLGLLEKKISKRQEEVDLDFVIKKWQRRIANSDENIKKLIELDNELIKPFEE